MKKIKKILSLLVLFILITFANGCDLIQDNLDKLGSITNLEVNETLEGYEVSFDLVEFATEYNYTLSKDGIKVLEGKITKGYIFKNLEAGNYIISIYAIGDESKYANGLAITYEFIIEEDTEITISKVLTSTLGSYKVTGKVIAETTQSFLLADSTGKILVYKGSSWTNDVEIGKVYEVNGTTTSYGGLTQFGTDSTYTVSTKEIIYTEGTAKEVTASMMDETTTSNVKIEYITITGVVTVSGTYANILVDGATIQGSLSALTEEQLKAINGKTLNITGYVIGITGNGKYYTMMLTDYEEVKPNNNDTKLHAYFPNDWKNVKVSVNGSSLMDLTYNIDHFEIGLGITEGTLRFYNESVSTETFNFDSERMVFICTDIKFNGLYSGYFTTKDAVSNEVVKLTTLELNDLHGYISQDTAGTGGLSNAAYIINQIRNENSLDDVVLIGNGDMFQGTGLSNITKGLSVVSAMNEMKFDCMGIGNHEFDWGIESILNYFDKNEENGEADFPLLNSNIVYANSGKVVLTDGYNMFDSIMLDKNGLKVGVISCIGDVYSSILYSRVKDYIFKDASDVAIPLAKSLRDAGADIVIVNIHGGDTSGVDNYIENIQIANAKYNDKNLVDIIIDGHTHTMQSGVISRSGTDLYAIQAGANCGYVGEIELYYDTVTDTVVSGHLYNYSVDSYASTNYDEKVEKILDDYYNENIEALTKVYCTAGQSVSNKSQLYTWSANVMKASTGADIAISNNGGIRSTGNIIFGKDITLENLLEINPFDNEIILVEVPGKIIYKFLQNSAIYYESNVQISTLQNSDIVYKIAVIDYVFYWDYFPNTYPSVNTKLIFREMMIKDLCLRESFAPDLDSKAIITNQYN